MIASFKGTEEFAAWFESLVDHSRLPTATLLEFAVIEYAKKIGFTKPAPKR